jgi:serine protease inhibitor
MGARWVKRLVLTGLAGALVAGCASAGSAAGPHTGSGASAPAVSRGAALRVAEVDPRPFGSSDTSFGLDVLRAWCQSDPRSNLVFSPSTLASALGMAYLGAGGATARAMAQALHLPSTGLALEAGLHARTGALAGLDGPGVTVAASNLLWADPTLVTHADYLNALETSYSAGVERVPLLSEPDQTAQLIDRAISDATRGHIRHLIEPSMLNQIGWVLTSALYLNAAWATPFDPNQTEQQPFTTAAQSAVTASYLNGTGFRYGAAGGWTGVSLPYRGGKLSMIALLPPASASNCAVPDAATVARIGAGTDGTAAVALPKVNLATTGSMNGVLRSLGMGVAFGSTADFTPLSPQACCIGFVQQAATLQVGENGTVGAAAAAVGVIASAGRAITGRHVVFDRPYLMMVTSSTGEPLFVARVANPVTG